jgi:streptogramin lyase
VLALFNQEDRDFYNKVGGFDLVAGMPWQEGPRRPGADKHGDSVWVPGWWGQDLVQIDIHTNKMTRYPLPTLDSGPYMTRIDKDHVVWMNFQNSDSIAKFDPKTKKFTEYYLPTLGTEIHGIGIMDHNGATEVSLAEERTYKVAHLSFRTRDQVKALKKQAQDVTKSSSPTMSSLVQ